MVLDDFEESLRVLILILVEVGFGDKEIKYTELLTLCLNPYSSGGGVRCS